MNYSYSYTYAARMLGAAIPYRNDLLFSSGTGDFTVLQNPETNYWEIENKKGTRNGIQHEGLTVTSNKVNNYLTTNYTPNGDTVWIIQGRFTSTGFQYFGLIDNINTRRFALGISGGSIAYQAGNAISTTITADTNIHTFILCACGKLWILDGIVDTSSIGKIRNILDNIEPSDETASGFVGESNTNISFGGAGVNGVIPTLFANFEHFSSQILEYDGVSDPVLKQAYVFESDDQNEFETVNGDILSWMGTTGYRTSNINKKIWNGVTQGAYIDQYGYSIVTYIVPPRVNSDLTFSTTLNAIGFPLENSGLIKRNIQINNSSIGNFNETDNYLSFDDLTGIIITSFIGTSTPTIVGNNIEFTAGTALYLELSDGSIFQFSETSGNIIFDVSGSNNHCTIEGTITNFWDNSNIQKPYNFIDGYEKYTNDSDPTNIIRVPYSLTPTISGYSYVETILSKKLNNSENTFDYSCNIDSPWFNQIGEYANFDGVGDYIETNYSFNNSDFELNIILQFNNVNRTIIDARDGSNDGFVMLYNTDKTIVIKIGSIVYTTSETFENVDFYCLNLKKTGNNWVLKMNDVEVINITQSYTLNVTNTAKIGTNFLASSTFFNGRMSYSCLKIEGVLVREYYPQQDHGMVDILATNNTATKPTYNTYDTSNPTDLTAYEQGDALYNSIYSRIYEDWAYTCLSSGQMYTELTQTYKLFEFVFNKSADANILSFILSDVNDLTGDNSYILSIRSTESILFARRDSGVTTSLFTTSASYIDVNTDYSIKIARNSVENEFFMGAIGTWGILIKGGVFTEYQLISVITGSNPIEDNTHTSFAYLNIDADTGDTISNVRANNYDSNPISWVENSGSFEHSNEYQDRITIYNSVRTSTEDAEVRKYTKPVGDDIQPTHTPKYVDDGSGGEEIFMVDDGSGGEMEFNVINTD